MIRRTGEVAGAAVGITRVTWLLLRGAADPLAATLVMPLIQWARGRVSCELERDRGSTVAFALAAAPEGARAR